MKNRNFPLRFTGVLLAGILVMSCDTTNHIPDEAALPEPGDEVARLENLLSDSGDYASPDQNADIQSQSPCGTIVHPGGHLNNIKPGTRRTLMGFPRTRWRGGGHPSLRYEKLIWGVLKPEHYQPGQHIWIERMEKNRPSTKVRCTRPWQTLGSTAYKYTYVIPIYVPFGSTYLYQICVTEPHIPGKDQTCTGWRDVYTAAVNKIPG